MLKASPCWDGYASRAKQAGLLKYLEGLLREMFEGSDIFQILGIHIVSYHGSRSHVETQKNVCVLNISDKTA